MSRRAPQAAGRVRAAAPGAPPAYGAPPVEPTVWPRRPVWFFDLDDTLHDATLAAFGPLNAAMTDYLQASLGLDRAAADARRRAYWQRHGATLLGLIRHHGTDPHHFLAETHRLPGLEARLRRPRADAQALARLPGRKFILTNGPAAYAARVLGTLGWRGFEALIAIEAMRVFGQWRPKPDGRMLRHLLARLKLPAHRAVLVDDTPGHLRAAHREGWRTVWMQGYHRPQSPRLKRLRAGPQTVPAGSPPPAAWRRPGRRPPHVCARISGLNRLRALTFHV